jgi:hypothetical protein
MIKRKRYLDKIENGFKHLPIIMLIGAKQVDNLNFVNSAIGFLTGIIRRAEIRLTDIL